MPVIQRFPTCLVRINPKDHNPPHFHVVMNDAREAWVEIATLEILQGKIQLREIAEVLAWAAANKVMLASKFNELQI